MERYGAFLYNIEKAPYFTDTKTATKIWKKADNRRNAREPRQKGGIALKLSEKIIELRKARGMTQEELAGICHVSRQSISKWEADMALPETEKLLILGETFQVSLDVLLKDELSVGGIQEIYSCGDNAVRVKRAEVYEGILIKESIEDDSVIDLLNVHKVELWNTGGKPRYWTALFFTCGKKDFPEQIAKVMIADPDRGGNWFVDFKAGNEKYIVFRDKVLKYRIGDQAQKDEVCGHCREMGITDGQMHWPE